MEIAPELIDKVLALIVGGIVGYTLLQFIIRLFEKIRTLGSYKFDRSLYTIWVRKDEETPGMMKVVKIKSKCAVVLKRYYHSYNEEYDKRTIKINDNSFYVFDRSVSSPNYIEDSLKTIDEKIMQCLRRHYELQALFKEQLQNVSPPKSLLLKDRFDESLDLPQDRDTEYNLVHFDNPDYVIRPGE